MTKKQRRDYFILYTIIFAAMAVLVFLPHISSGMTFIKDGDSTSQHYRVFCYYGEYLREILRTLLTEHRLVIPQWDFSIGFGASILTTFHYYIVGDPLALLSVLAAGESTIYLYGFLIVLRFYLAGAAFSGFVIYMGKKNWTAVLAGAFVYVFCLYAVNMGLYHPFFLNPMIYLPLVLIGVEKILRGEKPYLFIEAVFFSAVSSFYFFYMIVLLTVIYVCVRCALLYGWKQKKKVVSVIFRTGLFASVGVLQSAFILLPVLMAFFNDCRAEVSTSVPLLYDVKYYQKLIAAFTGVVKPEARTLLSYGAVSFAAAVLLFSRRRKSMERKTLKVLFCIGTLLLMLPAAGRIFNGMSYVTNRWSFGYSLLIAFILTSVWEEFFSVSAGRLAVLGVLSAAYAAWCIRYACMKPVLVLLGIIVLLTAVCTLFPKEKICQTVETLLLFTVLAGAVANARYLFVGETSKMLGLFQAKEEVLENKTNNPDKTIAGLMAANDGFWRYTGTCLQKNTSILYGTHGTQFYWSLSNGNVGDFRMQLQIPTTNLYDYKHLGGRTALGTLTGCRFYVCGAGSSQAVPGGHHYLGECDGYDIYENEYALPLGYTYSAGVTYDSVRNLNGAQKEETMQNSVLLAEVPEGYEQAEPTGSGYELAYEAECSEGVVLEENAFVVSDKEAEVILKITGGQGGEHYLGFEGFSYEGSYADASISAKTYRDGHVLRGDVFYYRTEKSPWATMMHDIMLSLGLSRDGAPDTIKITFSRKGRYQFEKMYVWYQPMEQYEALMHERAEDAWENEVIGKDTISADMTLAQDKLLVLSVPYDGGWTAYVDGQKQQLMKANYMFSALALSKGRHHIVMKYCTPGFRIGLVLSIAGFLLLALIRRAYSKLPASGCSAGKDQAV